MKTSQALFCVATVLGWASNAAAADDPFTPYLNSVPSVTQSLGQINSGSGATAITTKRFTFSSRGGVNTVYGVEAFPQQAGVYPALLLLHGGGSNADALVPMAQEYASRGYVALAIDLPGICDPTKTPYSSGPWKSKPAGEEPRFDVATGPENSTLVDAEVAGIEGFNWLRAQTNVSPSFVGITGFSWGGYSTTMLSGILQDKVKASYAVFGCGFYDKGSFWKDRILALAPAVRDTWLTYLDAGRRAPMMKAAYFLEGETNDTYFWPEAVSATIDAVTGTKNHVWGPNLNHMQLAAGPQMQRLYFDHYLKGEGSPFAAAQVSRIDPQGDGSKKVTIAVEIPAGVSIASTQLYYSEQGAPWQMRVWTAIDAPAEGVGTYTATIPATLAAKKLDYYGLVTDTRMVSTSTAMFDSDSTLSISDAGAEGASPADATADSTVPSRPPGESTSDASEVVEATEAGATAATVPTASTRPVAADANGCACRASSARSSSSGALGLLLASGTIVSARRRRRRPVRWGWLWGLTASACSADGVALTTPFSDAAADRTSSTPVREAAPDATDQHEAATPPVDDGGPGEAAVAVADAAIPDTKDLFADYQPIADGGLQEIKLYTGDPPNYLRTAPPETVGAGGRISSVSIPTLRRYPMNVGAATGIGFIVFPGGGYDHLDIENHATALANRMGPLGIAVFGLKYRVGTGSTDVPRDALLDAKRAVRLVRANASVWGVVPDRLGVVSYSAGSHLSLTLAGNFDAGRPDDVDPVERLSSRPTFIAPMCPWAYGSSTSPFTFLASTPPVFMCHAQDDTTAPIAMTMQVEKQLEALHVLSHLEIYPTGGHNAFNVGDATAPGRDWPDKLMPWLRDNDVVP
jgi:acetyl esterase/lipase